jgi:hypothetical protein
MTLCRRSSVRVALLAEAGEPEAGARTASETLSPTSGSKNTRETDESSDNPLKRNRGNELTLDDQNEFSAACTKLAPYFIGSCFPTISKDAIELMSESVVAAACAHLVVTKTIGFPFHRQFTSDSEVQTMIRR